MKPDTAAKEPVPASSSTKGVGVYPMHPSLARVLQSSSFLWKNCSKASQRDRVDIKQQAVLDGLRLGDKLSSKLRSQTNNGNQGKGTDELADWPERFENAKELYEIPHSTIGLIGVIGAGKSTLLNAILGEQNLLPSASDRAGTAVACQIVYKHGSDGYHADFFFRSRQSFTDELDELFQNLKTKQELRTRKKENPSADEMDDIEDQLDDLEKSTSDTLETLWVLFGVREADLGVTSANAFLEAYPLGVLGDVVAITESDRETFVTKIKPFLDSTPANHDGRNLKVWPLIERATIYLKSDFLKTGIQLVDLPGLDDSVECRSRVAERFTKYLDVTAVVAPAIRATEEKTAIGFIKRRQEDEMRMNGKFDRDSFCIVLSKCEDVNPNVYLTEPWIAKDHPNIKKHLDRAQRLDKIVRKADLGLGEFEREPIGHNTTAFVSKRGEVKPNRREFLALTESLKQAAMSIRNRSVSSRIQKNFSERRKAIKPPKHGEIFDDTVEVFPTSARAFQAIRHPGVVKEAGFPDERYTGIPRLKQWFSEATLNKREKHLDVILNRLSILFSRLQTWISVSETPLKMPIHDLQELASIHDRIRRSLTTLLRQSCKELRQVEPMKKKDSALILCQREYPTMIDRWRYAYPDQVASDRLLHGNVQSCILRKQGDYHKSRGRYPYEYQWIDALASVFIDEIVGGWEYTFRVTVPSFEIKIQKSLEHVWRRYMIALHDFCGEHDASRLRSSGQVQRAIEDAEENLIQKAQKVLEKLGDGARDVHPIFRDEIQRILRPVFQEAFAIKGKGCVRKRDKLLQQFAAAHSANMPVKACEAMDAALGKLINRHARALEKLSAGAVSEVEKQMKGLLGIKNATSSPAAEMNQKTLAAEMSPHLRSWKLCWEKPSSQREDHVMRGELSIPDPELLKVKGDEDGDQAAVRVVDTDLDARLMDRL